MVWMDWDAPSFKVPFKVGGLIPECPIASRTVALPVRLAGSIKSIPRGSAQRISRRRVCGTPKSSEDTSRPVDDWSPSTAMSQRALNNSPRVAGLGIPAHSRTAQSERGRWRQVGGRCPRTESEGHCADHPPADQYWPERNLDTEDATDDSDGFTRLDHIENPIEHPRGANIRKIGLIGPRRRKIYTVCFGRRLGELECSCNIEARLLEPKVESAGSREEANDRERRSLVRVKPPLSRCNQSSPPRATAWPPDPSVRLSKSPKAIPL